ncbi:MAG: hypothetical protein H0U27_02340 [Nitrosopumilus sp.]|nr:hypothetical protein [Nitrosopumilus sp.]
MAKLPEAKQTEFLTRASEEKLTVRELRKEIRKKNFKEPFSFRWLLFLF